ncbi:MAG: hypothetical protein RLZZ121_1024 [Bacteroidota bacterium]|nr:DUF4294 domain-containing protein [Bacteroidota bacterium]NBW42819.1 DUF4294 domain-containing protein [Sphingobacteriia bacterium]
MTRFNRRCQPLSGGLRIVWGLIWGCGMLLGNAQAQTPGSTRPMELPAYIDSNGDTVPVAFLPHVDVRDKRVFRSAADKKRFDRLYWNVMKVYPLAKAAGKQLNELELELQSIPEIQHRAHCKKLEASLKKQYKKQLMDLTVTQGRLLIKLVDRETARTSYSIVREFRGSFQAFMWQSLALLFGSSLKSTYELQEDRDIELILMMIEGQAYTIPYKFQNTSKP